MHSKTAICEACSNIGNVELKSGMALCDSCFASEPIVSKPEPELVKPRQTLNQEIETSKSIIESIQKMGDDLIQADYTPTQVENAAIEKLGQPAVKTMEDFFNARTQSIVEMEAAIMTDDSIPKELKHFECGRRVKEHYLQFTEVIKDAVRKQLEHASSQKADTYYLNNLARRLSEEHREKLHLENLDYTPKAPPKSVNRAPSLTKSDKLAESYSKIMNIPFEQAKKLLEAGLSKAGINCTCKETPGMCKVHQ